MPIEGYTSITVSDEVYARLKELAEKTHRSISKMVEHLIQVHGVSEERHESASIPVTSIPKSEETSAVER